MDGVETGFQLRSLLIDGSKVNLENVELQNKKELPTFCR